MKRNIAILAISLLIIQAGYGQTVLFRADTVIAYPGDSVSVGVYASNFNGMGSLTLHLVADNNYLKYGRIANLNPGLANGIFAANSVGNIVSIAWADYNGAGFSSGKLFDLRFKYVGGSAAITAFSGTEVTDTTGIIKSWSFSQGLVVPVITVSITAPVQKVCPGSPVVLTANASGGLGSYSYAWYSDPPGFSSSQKSPTVTPSVPTVYYAIASEGFYSDTASYAVGIFTDQVIPAMTGLIPADSAEDVGESVTLSWAPKPNALFYDVYVWPASQSVPANPTKANLTQISTSVNLAFGTVYKWKVVGRNNCWQSVSNIQTFTTSFRPDLHVSTISFSQAQAGQTMQVSWTVTNDGVGPTNATLWYDRVWISPDREVINGTAGHVLLGQFANPSYLGPGQSYNQSVQVTLPLNLIGTYYLFVITDAFDACVFQCTGINPPNPYNPPPYLFASSSGGAVVNVVKESSDAGNYHDNFNFREVLFPVPPLPDLKVTGIVISPTNPFSGQAVNVTWTVKNDGDASTLASSWYDRIYFSADTILDNSDKDLGRYHHSGILDPDSTYTRTEVAVVPNFISGRYYFLVKTDIYSNVFEYVFNENNVSSSDSVTIFLTPPPDLAVTSIQISSPLSNREQTTIKWVTRNQGFTSPHASYWYDRVYISRTDTFNVDSCLSLGELVYSGPLTPGSTYTSQMNIQIPAQINGLYYFYVFTDIYDYVFENLSNQNNIRRSTAPVSIISPDLQVLGIYPPLIDSTGLPFMLYWYVFNNGPGRATNLTWKDQAYISTVPVFSPQASVPIGDITYTRLILPADSLFMYDTMFLPNLADGLYYIHLYTDINNQVFENGLEQNNWNTSPTPLLIRRPDLVPKNIALPDTASSGQPVTLSWTIKNQGTGAVSGQKITDRIYVDVGSSLNPVTARLIGTTNFIANLNAGDSQNFTQTFALPNGIYGDYYIFVATDDSNKVAEGGNEGNNTKVSDSTLYIKLSPWPDLRPMQVLAPDTVTGGAKIAGSFTVRNTGIVQAQGTWKDKLYITKDTSNQFKDMVFLKDFSVSLTLLPLGDYTTSFDEMLPANLPEGNYYLWVYSDADNQLYEHTDEGNNGRASAKIYVKPYPMDLAVNSVTASLDTILSGSPLQLQYTSSNAGTVKITTSTWKDAFFLSSDSVMSKDAEELVHSWTVNGPLDIGSNYTKNINLNLPNGISGDYYYMLCGDYLDAMRDVNRSNNCIPVRDAGGTARPVHIVLSPSPDLVVTSFSAPAQISTGQEFRIYWTAKNQGNGDISGKTWTDAVYLSTDFEINQGDAVISTKAINKNVPVGQEYSDSADVLLTGAGSGNYILILKLDYTDKIYEHNGEDNNTDDIFTIITQPPPSDLVVNGSAIPSTAGVGDVVHVEWFLENKGTNLAKGTCKDALYLSSDTIWDPSDFSLGVLSGNINLAPLAELMRSTDVKVPGVPLGNYYLIVKTDVQNAIPETNDTNNTYYSTGTIFITVPLLPLNTHVSDTLWNSTNIYYRIEIPDSLQDETLLIVLKGDSIRGTNELYVSHEAMPDRINYDYKYSFLYSGNQELVIPETDKGNNYLLIYGNTYPANFQIVDIYATKVNFEVRRISPNQGGNTGTVTVKIQGAKFEPGMAVQIKNDILGEFLQAPSVYYVNSTTIYATFNLTDGKYIGDEKNAPVEAGFYDLIVIKPNGQSITVPSGFEVVAGTGQQLLTNIVYPSSTRPNRYITMTIQFGNGGNVDIPTPTASLVSLFGAPLGFTMEELQFNYSDLWLEFQDPTGPPGVLPPGSAWSITVYSYSSARMRYALIRE